MLIEILAIVVLLVLSIAFMCGAIYMLRNYMDARQAFLLVTAIICGVTAVGFIVTFIENFVSYMAAFFTTMDPEGHMGIALLIVGVALAALAYRNAKVFVFEWKSSKWNY